MEQTIWIFTSREKVPSIPALGFFGRGGAGTAEIVCNFGEVAHSDGRYDFT